MLHLIFGRSGFGKTEKSFEIAGKAASDDKNVILMVPEQFTFETEKTVIRKFGEKSCLNIEVLSFSRLVHRVMSIYGGLASRYIDDCGRSVLMKLSLSQIGDLLKVYSKQAGSPAFVKTMVSAVAEYKMCCVDADMLDDAAKQAESGLLQKKLSDIALIMRTYCANLDSSFSDSLDDLTRLSEKLDDCPFFEGKTVIIDGFKGFTPQERKVIGKIMARADDVFVTLCAEGTGKADGEGLFSPVEKTARRLITLANKDGVKVASPEVLGESHRFENDVLSHLEASVFRPKTQTFEGDAPEITVVEAGDTYDEAEFVASEITKLVREKGCRYKDIAVISRGWELYDGILDTVFDKYGIPLFYDARRGVATHPLMAMVLSLMSIICDNFRQDNVLRYLKTGIAGFSTLEVSKLENYMLMWDISGEDAWKSDFLGSTSGFDKIEGNEDELKELNELRRRFYEPIAEFKENLEEMPKPAALYDFLCKAGVREAVNRACRELKDNGEIRLSNEYAQIFEKLIAMLDQISIASANMPLSTEDFASMLALVIENTDLGSIPPSLDAVCAGDAERIRTDGAKYVFVMGLCEGVFPKSAAAGGLISDSERRDLINIGLELAPPSDEQAAEERFFAYKAFTCASRGVYLSTPRADSAGKTLRPSYFLPAVRKIFPKLNIIENPLENPLDRVVNEKTAFDLFASNFKEKAPLREALKEVFDNKENYGSKKAALERSANGRRLHFKNPETARALYGENMNLSPSKIETYRKCKFLYFCRYGLSAKPRKQAALDAPEIGTVIHFVLEKLLKKADGRGLENIPEEELDKMTAELLTEFAETYFGGLENKPARFRFIFGSLANTVMCLIKHMAKEFAQSGFRPVDFELAIAKDGDVKPFEMKLDDGGKIVVGGKVDRVDTMEIKGKTYLRVIDYKTGTKVFSLDDIVYGLNLQMFIYLFILCDKNGDRYTKAEDLLPAGVLYVPAKKPNVSASRFEEEEKIEADADKELKMNGIVLDNPDVILGMESDGNGKFIPAALKQSVEEEDKIMYAVTGRSSVASLEQFGIMKRHIEKLLHDMAKTLRSGDAAAVPINGLGYNPCDYCDYSCVCGFEAGSETENIYKCEKEEVYKKMEEVSDDGTK